MTPAEVQAVFDGLDKSLSGFTTAWGTEALTRIQQRTPVRTGALKSDWTMVVAPGSIEENNTMPYASFIEMGTPKMRAQPMVRTTVLEADQISVVAAKKVGLP